MAESCSKSNWEACLTCRLRKELVFKRLPETAELTCTLTGNKGKELVVELPGILLE